MTGFAWGPPPVRGQIRVFPEDFQVTENLGFTPDGHGEHLWLFIEKREQNTAHVAVELARAAGVHARHVSFAGLKDRNAVTRQYFSIHLPGQDDPDWQAWELDGVRILEGGRSSRKIQRGRLSGNGFELIVRDVDGDLDALEQRLATIRDHGVPNGFGEQRFGGNNISRAHDLFAGRMRRKPSKNKRGFYLSAARSLIFNRVLVERMEAGTWNRLIDGEVAILNGSQSWFSADSNDPEQIERCRQLDIHPSGPLAGEGDSPATGQARELEASIYDEQRDLYEGLIKFRLKHQRRPLRMKVEKLEWTWLEPKVVCLRFELGQGSYATSVLREVVEY